MEKRFEKFETENLKYLWNGSCGLKMELEVGPLSEAEKKDRTLNLADHNKELCYR